MEKEKLLEKKDIVCFHCGEEALNTNYTVDQHLFCCVGCQSVYLLLNQYKLSNYYKYNTHPGKTNSANDTNLDYLEEPKIEQQLIDFKNDEITIITFYVPNMHCSSCIWLLENLYKINNSIVSSRTDFMKKQVSITYKHGGITLKALVELLISIGYEPTISLQDVVKEKKKNHDSRLIRQIALAGFCFGNSMMISFPEYFGMASFERQYSSLFGYINLGLAIPSLLYCGRDYFTSAWHSLRQKRLNLDVPLALGIFILFLRSAIDIIGGHGIGFSDTLCGLIFFLLIGKWVQQRTYYHLSFERDYRSYFPIAITKIENGKHQSVPLADIQVGNRLLIRNNEVIPADSILLQGEASIDFSFVTGESQPVSKTLGEIVYAGGKQMGQAIEVEVVKSVSQSYLTRLWNDEQYQNEQNQFESFSNMVSRYFTPVLLTIAIAATSYWMYAGDATKAWSAFTAVLIIACPCALALSSPFTLSAALSIFDKNKFYLKNTLTVEKLATISQIIFDKTGTITSPKAVDIVFEGHLTDLEKIMVANTCQNSSHPLSREIHKSLASYDSDMVQPLHYEEVIGSGIKATYGIHQIAIGSRSLIAKETGSAMPQQTGSVFVSIDGVYKGCFLLNQQWRKELNDVIGSLKSKYDLHMLSGDGDQLKNVLSLIFPNAQQLHFQQSPQDKLRYIQVQQSKGQRVCMLGDGLNDAAALKQANVGIAISDDINNFSPGCDAILDGSSFGKLPRFLSFSKDTIKVIHSSFVISMCYNVVGLSFAVQGTMSPLFAAILMPLSTVTIISFTSLATHFFAKRNKL
ncbi:heavy metal translocating P-type ATPase [Olivibacter sitiensis]|uniref:heavy metal translocating P-type ATPase n=1 Tax=Olivibacter sitiensis TaxID=376470 RepID=UPI0004184E15|nr:heavy metal translocating P-type ATPase metal-binding domain-containing protein [Olivibacter sitiensis]